MHKSNKHKCCILLLLTLSLFLVSNCTRKPDGNLFIDTMIFSNFLTNALTPMKLRVQVKGLASGANFTISNQDSESLTISKNGDFEFPKMKTKYSEFSISILSQPVTTPSQTCVITNPVGILSPNHNTVEINCGTKFFPLNLNVFGISTGATGILSVRNGSVDTLNISSDGTYEFSAQVPDLGSYSATILTRPNMHDCILEPLPASIGTINGAPVTLNVNCLSQIHTFPIDQTAIGPNDNLIITFSKPLTPMSCSFVAPPGTCSADLSASALPSVPADYSGNRLTVRPNVNWNAGLRQCIQLAACTEAGTNRVFNPPRPNSYAVTNQIKYVSAGGAVAGACNSVATACANIQYAVSQCNVLSSCFVLVSQGTYSIATIPDRILLIDRLQLLGGFSTDFQSRNTTTFQTIIRDDIGVGGCGSNDATSCTPISGSAMTLNSDVLVQGFTIITNSNNRVSTGIHLNNVATGPNSITIDNNIILGTNSAAPYALMIVRSGIYASTVSPSFRATGNYVLGGSGNSMSVGMRILNGTQGLIQNNRISGGSHVNVNDGLDSSIGILINNTVNNTTQSLVIANNIINAFHLNGTPAVSATTSFGIQALSINSPNFYVLHNTIYGGNGATRSYGIQQQSSGLLNINVLNNQVISNSAASDQICLNYGTNSVNTLSNLRGNNLFGCNIPVTTSAGNFRFCGPEPSSLKDSIFCMTPITNLTALNFNHDPLFATPTGNLDVMLLNSNSRCGSVYGGVDPGYPLPLSQVYLRDIRALTRSTNIPPTPVPSGSFGYSIGAYEYEGTCVP